MNKAEYISDLQSKTQYVGNPRLNPTVDLTLTGGAKTYDIWMILKLKTGAFVGAVQPFYVLNEGTAEETVYPSIREFKDEDEVVINPFKDQVRAYIDATYISATIPKVTIDVLNEEQEFAICTAYVLVADQITTKKYFLAKGSNGAPYLKEYIG